jgi:hypothetical protein
LDFTYGLYQAGVDGDVKYYGKPNRNDAEMLTRNERLVSIEPSHWRDFEMDVWRALHEKDNFFIWTLNKRNSDIKRGGYADVHADREQLMIWLKTAQVYKGHTKRS